MFEIYGVLNQLNEVFQQVESIKQNELEKKAKPTARKNRPIVDLCDQVMRLIGTNNYQQPSSKAAPKTERNPDLITRIYARL
jgi:hypothetical protein